MLQLLIYLARCRRVQRRVQRVIPRVMTRENPILPTTLLPYCYLRSFSTVLSGPTWFALGPNARRDRFFALSAHRMSCGKSCVHHRGAVGFMKFIHSQHEITRVR